MSEIDLKPLGTIIPESQLTSVRYSPCGNILAASGFDQSIHRWDLRDMPDDPDPKKLEVPSLAKVGGHNGFVSALEFHPKRQIAFSADSWGQIRAWPYLGQSPEPLWTLPEAHDGWVRDLSIGDDGDWIASCGRNGAVRIFSTIDGDLLSEFAGHNGEDVFAVAVHPTGKYAVSGDLRGRILQWEVRSGKVVRGIRWLGFLPASSLAGSGWIKENVFRPRRENAGGRRIDPYRWSQLPGAGSRSTVRF